MEDRIDHHQGGSILIWHGQPVRGLLHTVLDRPCHSKGLRTCPVRAVFGSRKHASQHAVVEEITDCDNQLWYISYDHRAQSGQCRFQVDVVSGPPGARQSFLPYFVECISFHPGTSPSWLEGLLEEKCSDSNTCEASKSSVVSIRSRKMLECKLLQDEGRYPAWQARGLHPVLASR